MSNEYVYIGAAPCGCVVSACIDSQGHERDTAKSIAESVRQGLLVSRIPNSAASPFTKCDSHKDITDHSAWIEAMGLSSKRRKSKRTS